MRQALELFPGYAFGLDGMAQAQVALGHVTAALRYEQEAVNRIPLPQYVGLLGDLYHASGNQAAAQQQYSLIGDIERLLAANGVRNDLDIALFDVDHGIRLQHALGLARQGFTFRPSDLRRRRARRGRSRATAPAPRRCTTPACRYGSGPATPSSTSTAA